MRKLVREPFFLLILVMPFVIGLVMHDLLPYVAGQVHNFDLQDYYPLIVALFILTPPLYYGVVLALQVLEEKDEDVLIAVAVTPMQLHTFLFARIALYTLISLPQVVIVHEMINVIELEMTRLILIAIAACLNTPLIVLLLAALARNQVEGFVIGKGMGFIILFPLAMYFVPDYWHVLCGILPTYWPIIAYFTAVSEAGSELFFYLAIAMAIVTQSFATLLLYRKFAAGLLST
ncbi:MAG: hypothetical protein NZ777_19800 [Pseudomonadales bacterium]|nr:hypothetical protein [Pseudomonadales bacterium]